MRPRHHRRPRSQGARSHHTHRQRAPQPALGRVRGGVGSHPQAGSTGHRGARRRNERFGGGRPDGLRIRRPEDDLVQRLDSRASAKKRIAFERVNIGRQPHQAAAQHAQLYAPSLLLDLFETVCVGRIGQPGMVRQDAAPTRPLRLTLSCCTCTINSSGSRGMADAHPGSYPPRDPSDSAPLSLWNVPIDTDSLHEARQSRP
jgi:hypothetical protein